MCVSIHTFMQCSRNKTVLLHDGWPKMNTVETAEFRSPLWKNDLHWVLGWRGFSLELAHLAEHQHSSCTVPLCLSLRSKQGLIALMTLCTSYTTGNQKGWRLPKEQHSSASAKSSQLKQERRKVDVFQPLYYHQQAKFNATCKTLHLTIVAIYLSNAIF